MTMLNRRLFLIQTSGTLFLFSSPLACQFSEDTIKKNTGLAKQDWQNLDILLNHLLPSETTSPGAKDINATGYFYFVLSDKKTNPSHRQLIQSGLIQLNQISHKSAQQTFQSLTTDAREKALRQIETTDQGYRWLRMVLRYLMEALLTDPIYGGNTNQIGWLWLKHQPGFPRPPANKKYFLL